MPANLRESEIGLVSGVPDRCRWVVVSGEVVSRKGAARASGARRMAVEKSAPRAAETLPAHAIATAAPFISDQVLWWWAGAV